MKLSLPKMLAGGILSILLFALLAWLFIELVPEPPMKEINDARTAIAYARNLNAVIYSAKLFREATSFYDSAMITWRKENDRFILFRDYEQVCMFAELSAKKAKEAAVNTIKKSNDLMESLSNEINTLNGEMEKYEKIYLSVPLSEEISKRHAKGKLLLKEAEIDFENREYVKGMVKITEANDYLKESYTVAIQKLTDYFEDFSTWQEWLSSTIIRSRENGSYAVVVEKIPGVCSVYYKGVKKYTFEAEFGKNWMGDKVSRGDYATPEGKYLIVKKLNNGSTRYHKALMLNYPNLEDLEEFNLLVSRGVLPSDAKIGELIEIHGEGGKGINWTEGCVALKNSDMDILYRYTDKGTAVTIIGSSLTLEEYILDRQNDLN